MTHRVRRRLLVSAGLAVAVATLLTVAHQLTFFSTAQVRSIDFLFQARGDGQARSTIIVGIDQRSYRALAPRYGMMANWPRTLYAQVLQALHQAGARVVILDLLFDAPKPEDRDVATAMRRAGNVIVPVEAVGPKGIHPGPGIAQGFRVFYRSTGTIAQAAAGEGFVNVTTDPDTVVRSLPLVLQAGDEQLPALALTAVAHFIRRPTVIDAPPSDSEVYAAGRAIPVLASGSMLINFLGPSFGAEQGGPFTMLSFADVLTGSFDQALVDDKIVLVGLTLPGLDEFSTPSTSVRRMWGLEVLGNAIETILGQRYLVPAPSRVTIGLIFILAVGASLLAGGCRPPVATFGMLCLLGLYLLTAGALFDAGILLNLVYPPSAILLAFGSTMVYRVRFEQAAERRVRELMARYLSPKVSQWVLREPDRVKLGGESRDMTVLFSDLRGFTTLSHTLDPQTLVSLLNEYMTAMTRIVFKHDGVLDKYIGDAIMAFWNAPMEQPDHARRACHTALEMIEKLGELQADWKRRGMPLLELGIGINSGPMVVGNMGSLERLSYTVLGDTVNVASRLEGLSKEYGAQVVISEATRAAAGPAFEYRYLDVVAVKGRSQPLAVYEVVGCAGQLSPGVVMLLECYQRGIELYRARRWRQAAELFREIHASAPNDGPVAFYLRRSSERCAHPPPAEWNGVHVAESK